MLYIILGIMIPFIGTTLGSFLVFFLKNNISDKTKKLLLGFASGVMLAASIWSLILPSIELSKEKGIFSWIPAAIGLFLGILFLIYINKITEKLESKKDFNMLFFSITMHNIPEGMAVGVCLAGLLAGTEGITLLSSMLLSLGIGIQNIPEGSIISMPLKMRGKSKKKAFCYGVLSGVVEPISSVITILLLNLIVPLLPYVLTFAAGAMIYVVIEELIPEMHDKKTFIGLIGTILGFIIMMALDVSFS